MNFKDTIERGKTLIIAYWAKLQDALALFFRWTRTKLRQLILPLQKLFGFTVIKHDLKSHSVDVSSYLTDTDQKLAEIPAGYREKFEVYKDIEEDWYVPASGNIVQFRNALKKWEEGFASNMAVIGEKGSGKSTFISLAEKECGETDSIRIDVKETYWKTDQMLTLFGQHLGLEDFSKPEAIIRGLNNLEENKVVFLENMQNLFLRNINGFMALEALWLIMAETKEKVFWVVSCSRYTWQFLNKAFNADTHFSYILNVDTLGQPEIKNLIMNRHKATGFRLVFEPDESIRKSRAYKKRLDKPAEVQKYLEEEFFERLAAMAEGNCSIALILWLRSLEYGEKRNIIVRPVEVAVIDELDVLTPDVLFVIASIIMHDTLKVTDLTRVMNSSVMESRVILTKLKSRGILHEMNGSYYLNQLVYRQMLRLLKSKNLIH